MGVCERGGRRVATATWRVTWAMPMEKALGESRQRSQTSHWGKSLISTVKRDRQPNTTVSMEPTVLANLGFLKSGVSMKEKKICQKRRKEGEKRGKNRECLHVTELEKTVCLLKTITNPKKIKKN